MQKFYEKKIKKNQVLAFSTIGIIVKLQKSRVKDELPQK